MYSHISLHQEWHLHIKVEWQSVMSDGTVAKELLVAPHSALTCIMTFACGNRVSEQESRKLIEGRYLYIGVLCAYQYSPDSKSRCGLIDLE